VEVARQADAHQGFGAGSRLTEAVGQAVGAFVQFAVSELRRTRPHRDRIGRGIGLGFEPGVNGVRRGWVDGGESGTGRVDLGNHALNGGKQRRKVPVWTGCARLCCAPPGPPIER